MHLLVAVLALFSTTFSLHAQVPPPPSDAGGIPVDRSQPIELEMELPPSPGAQPATPADTSTTRPSYIAILAEVKNAPGAPAFLADITTVADLDTLTDDQKTELENFMATIFAVPGTRTGNEQGTTENTVSCFDYYHFGSVQVDLSHTTGSSVNGSSASFSGTVTNNNDYPVVDGAVYVKLFRLPTEGGTPVQGHDVVDQFFVQEGIDLPAHGTLPLSFAWQVPAHLAKGEYQAAFFYTSAHKFNLLGLSFTDDVVGNTSTFTVASEVNDRVYLDKNEVTVDGQKYYFVAFTPKVDVAKPIDITTTLVNETADDALIPVMWKVYRWDAQTEVHLVDTSTETVIVPAGESRMLTYAVTDTASSVYLTTVEAQYEDTKSILNIRFTRDGVPTTRINFPALMSYPLVEGQEATVFSCLHGAGTLDLVPNGKLTLTLTDRKGNTIHAYTYEGGVTGAMMAVKDSFVPSKSYDTFTLTAELYRDGSIVDKAKMQYECLTLNKGVCAPEDVEFKGSFFGGDGAGGIASSLLGILALVLALLLVGLVWKRKQGTTPTTPGSTTGTLVLALVLFGGLSGGAGEVEAKSVTWNTTSVPGLYYPHYSVSDWWTRGLDSNSNVSVTYRAVLENLDTGGIVNDGDVLPVGANIRVNWNRLSSDISWFGTGYTADTPVGVWLASAADPGGNLCVDSYYTWVSSVGFKAFIPLAVHPPTMSVNASGASCIGNSCTITGEGNVSITANFPATYAKFYFAYTLTAGGTCYHDNDTPMRSCSFNLGTCFDAEVSQYSLSVPAQSIQHNLIAVSPNAPPNAPTITGLGGEVGASLPFTFTATDPDGDQIRYGIDWDNSGTVDEWLPPLPGLVNSGVTRSVNHQWATAGPKTFKARTQDSNSTNSGWTTHTVTIVNPPRLICCPSLVPAIRVGTSRTVEARYWPARATAPFCGATGYTNVTNSSTWSSASPGIASVLLGAISGVTAGNTAITATYNGMTASCNAPVFSTSLSASPNPCTIASGSAECQSTVSWTANNIDVTLFNKGTGAQLSTDESGSLTQTIPHTGATYELRNASNGTVYETLFVGANCATNTRWDGTQCSADTVGAYCKVCPATVSLNVGGTTQLQARYWDAWTTSGTTPTCTSPGYDTVTNYASWWSSASSTVSVNTTTGKGFIRALLPDDATIFARYTDQLCTTYVTVNGTNDNGVCGPAHGGACVATRPVDSDLCASTNGSQWTDDTASDGSWNWRCLPTGTGSAVACSKSKCATGGPVPQ